MKTIKFRAWLPKANKMAYGIEQDQDLADILLDNNTNNKEFYIVMQFTRTKRL